MEQPVALHISALYFLNFLFTFLFIFPLVKTRSQFAYLQRHVVRVRHGGVIVGTLLFGKSNAQYDEKGHAEKNVHLCKEYLELVNTLNLSDHVHKILCRDRG